MRSSLALVLSLLVVAPCAHAQAPAQDSCETVTTVHCTGSVAPLAVRPAAAPVPAAAPAPPAVPSVLPPVPAPPDDACVECAAPPEVTTRPALPPSLDGGWRLQLPGDASAAYVRTRRVPRPSVWAPGLVLWLGSYVASMAVGIGRDNNPYTAIPVFGALGTGVGLGLWGDTAGAVGYTFAGLGQIAGMITFIVGMAGGPAKLEKMPVQIVPLASKDGGGFSLGMKF